MGMHSVAWYLALCRTFSQPMPQFDCSMPSQQAMCCIQLSQTVDVWEASMLDPDGSESAQGMERCV